MPDEMTDVTSVILQGGPIKNVALYFCPYLRQSLTNFPNSFTGSLYRHYIIKWLLYIPLHQKCISTLPC